MNTPIESKDQARELTTTSYGVLAVLALRDHSTYELTKQLRFSLRYLWPRAESNMYAEPKRLVAAGLAESRQEWIGERRRTVYSITGAGRASLADWLAAPSSRTRYESEAVLKILFCENGELADLRQTLRAIREEALDAVAHWQGVADLYEGGDGQYPGRFGQSALVARLLGEQEAVTARWAAWAEQVVDGWDEPASADVDWGVATVRATGEPFPLADDPVGDAVARRDARSSRQRAVDLGRTGRRRFS
jgi:DNA-binding PadR family transcriptional regulator